MSREQILINNNNYENSIFVKNTTHPSFEIKNFSEDEFIDLINFIKSTLNPLSEIHINEEVTFYQKTFYDSIDLSKCVFNKSIIFRECVFKKNVSIKESDFKAQTVFKKSKFEGKVRFHHSKFRTSVNFENSIFMDLVDFYQSTFYQNQQFFLTDFLGVTIFSHAKFKKQVQFLYNKTHRDTIISFENAVFKESLDLSRANFWCKMSFWNTWIKYNPEQLWLYETDEIQEIQIGKPLNAYKRLRETYRIIKDVYTKEGNHIAALNFYKNEMLIFNKEIDLKENNKFEDLFSLFFNRVSNLFGTSWLRGVAFTLIITTIFYSFFLATMSDQLYFVISHKSISETTKHLIEFLNIAKWDIKPFGIVDYNWGYVVLFIGRIFIGYGYYQTIQAFRKYGKS